METSSGASPLTSKTTRIWVIYAALAILLIGATIVFIQATPEPNASPKAGVTLDLPEDVLDLVGIEQEVSTAELEILPDDTLFAKRAYAPVGSDPENLPPGTIGCQIVLSGTDRRSIHRPEACLRGQGWTIENGGVLPVTLADGSELDVMQLVINRPIEVGGEKRTLTSLYLYWFVSQTSTTPYHWERIAKTNVDLLLHNETHRWAYIIVNMPVLKGFVPGGLNQEETLKLLTDFISEAAPQFQRIGEGVEITAKPPIRDEA